MNGVLRDWMVWVYASLLLMFASIIILLRFLYVDIAFSANGLLVAEQEIVPVMTGTGAFIDSVYVKESERVKAGQLLAVLKNPGNTEKLHTVVEQELQKEKELADVRNLLRALESAGVPRCRFLHYSRCWQQYVAECVSLQAGVDLAEKELESAAVLHAEKIIATEEYQRRLAAYREQKGRLSALNGNYKTRWSADSVRLRQELVVLHESRKALLYRKEDFELRAPGAGRIQGVRRWYRNGWLNAGVQFCSVFPEEGLRVEAWVSPEDIAFLDTGMRARIKIRGLDYQYFGWLEGNIVSVDAQYEMQGNMPSYRIICSLPSRQLSLSNGFTVHLQKGMQAELRIVLTRRNIGQLLFDRFENWLDPVKKI